MTQITTDVKNALLLFLTPSGRARARRLRDAETEALVVIRRLEVAEILAGIGSYHLKLADLTRERLTAERPALAETGLLVIDGLARTIRSELDHYALRQRAGVHRR